MKQFHHLGETSELTARRSPSERCRARRRSRCAGRPYRAGRSPDWVKVKNRKHPAMQRVMEAFGSPKPFIAASRHGVGNKWVRIHVPRVAQLAHISSPTLGSVEAAQGESHSFRNRRGHGSLPTRAIILSKGGISARCSYERGER